MKINNIALLIMIFISAYFISCREKEEDYKLYIVNNSEKTIVVSYGRVKDQIYCLGVDSWEPEIPSIPPYSTKYDEGKGSMIVSDPLKTLYIDIFLKTDVDNMSCDEFKERFPIKKQYAITMADMEQMNWTLVYP